MATTHAEKTRDSYIESRAHLVKARFERRLNRKLDVQTERLMPGPNGTRYRADIVLQDPDSGLPVVVIEVKKPGTTVEQAREKVQRVLDSMRFIELLGPDTRMVALLVPLGEEAVGKEIVRDLAPHEHEVAVEVL